MTTERLPNDDVPSGHTQGFRYEGEVSDESIPDKVSLVMPIYHGPAAIHCSLIDECSRCSQKVWRSPRNHTDLYRLCYDCADEVVPDVMAAMRARQ